MKGAVSIINKLLFRTKQDLVYEEIKQGIVDCSLAPGERLIISELAKRLDVSTSPVREALKRLITENFVVEKNGSLYAAPLTPQAFLSLLDVRLDLEKVCIRRVAEYVSDLQLQELKSNLEKMKTAVSNEDWEAYYIYHRDFHNNCFHCCNVSFLARALIDAWDHHERGIKFFKLTPWRTKPDIEQHEKLFNAIAEHDPNKAEAYLVQNRERAFQLYREKLIKM